MHAIFGHGRVAGLNGNVDVTIQCVRELLEIDPEENIGAQQLAQEVGLISAVDAEAGMAILM